MTKEQVHALLSSVAKCLHAELNIDNAFTYSRDVRAVFKRQDGKEILVLYWGSADKLEISGSYPRYADGRYAASAYCLPSELRSLWDKRVIKVSATRSAESIAKDIERRFYPVFEQIWEGVAKEVAASDSYAAQRKETLQKLADLFGTDVWDGDKVYLSGRWRLQHCGLNTCSLEIHDLTLDQVAQIKRVLGE